MRERGLAAVDKIADMSGIEGPYAICFFLPPGCGKTDLTGRAAMQIVEAAQERYER
jgi:ATP-dependent 26S proteasome regulatory subunit